jgi:hypothetical protein
MLMYGDPKVGKSYAALQLALALQSGKQWLGFEIPQKARTVYVQLDTPRSLWADRLEQLASTEPEIHHLLLADRGTLATWPFDILNPAHLELLRSSLTPLAPDVVIIDVLKESHHGNENESDTMQRVLSSLVAATQPAAIVLIHHAKKPMPESSPDIINDMRGGYIAGAMDAIVRLSPHTAWYVGRAIEFGSIKIQRMDNGMWVADEGEFEALLDAVIGDTLTPSLTEKAISLASLTGKSIEHCKSALRRRMG